MKRVFLLSLGYLLSTHAFAQFAMHWDILDSSDTADLPPESLVVLDLFFDIEAPTDAFNACGIRAETRERQPGVPG